MEEKERSRKMDNLRELLGIGRMNKVLNARIREMRGAKKGLDKKIDEGMLQPCGKDGDG